MVVILEDQLQISGPHKNALCVPLVIVNFVCSCLNFQGFCSISLLVECGRLELASRSLHLGFKCFCTVSVFICLLLFWRLSPFPSYTTTFSLQKKKKDTEIMTLQYFSSRYISLFKICVNTEMFVIWKQVRRWSRLIKVICSSFPVKLLHISYIQY